MNISQLCSELQEEADELDLDGFAPQLQGVHSRVQAARRRRRRTTAATIIAVAVGVAATFALGLRHKVDPDPAPVAPVHEPVYDSPTYPAHVGSYHLLSPKVGEPGDSRISLSVQKPSGRFTIDPACSGPDGLDTKLVVNGREVGGVFCSPHQAVTLPGWPIRDLIGNGVDLEPTSITISLTLVRGRFTQERTNDPGTVLGLAVYLRDQHG